MCALAIVLLTKRMTRPLDELYGASRRIARGDYTARAEVATQDEIGSVAESFNAMAEAVQKMWMRWRFPRASVKRVHGCVHP